MRIKINKFLYHKNGNYLLSMNMAKKMFSQTMNMQTKIK